MKNGVGGVALSEVASVLLLLLNHQDSYCFSFLYHSASVSGVERAAHFS